MGKIERWYGTEEAARITGLHVATIRRAIKAGHLKATKYKHWRISRPALKRFWAFRGNDPDSLPYPEQR